MRGGASLLTLLGDIKSFFIGGHQNLPLVLAGTFLILGLMSANYAMLFIVFGFVLVTPILSNIINLVVDTLLLFFPPWLADYFQIKNRDLCDIIIGFPHTAKAADDKATSFTTTWLSMMVFILSYLMFNALALLNRDVEYPPLATDDVKQQVDSGAGKRRTQAIISIFTITILTLFILGTRYASGCETAIGTVSTLLIFGGVGYGWYKMLSSVGQDRLSDIFGIANRLLGQGAMMNAPIACLPTA